MRENSVPLSAALLVLLSACGGAAGIGEDAGSGETGAQDGGGPDAGTADGGATSLRGPGQRFGDSRGQKGLLLAADPMGNVALLGSYSGTVDLGGGPGPTTDNGVFLRVSTAQGTLRYGRTLTAHAGPTTPPGSVLYVVGQGLGMDGAGNTYVAGRFMGQVDFGGRSLDTGRPPLGASLSSQLFVAKFNAVGTLVWAKQFGVEGGDNSDLSGFAVSAAGAVTLAGSLARPLSLGGPTLESGGFVARLDPDGAHLFSRNLVATLLNSGSNCLAVDGQGNTYLVGSQGLSLDGQVATGLFVLALNPTGGLRWLKGFGGRGALFAVAAGPDDALYLTGELLLAADFGGGLLQNTAGDNDLVVVRLTASQGTFAWNKVFGDAANQSGRTIAADSSGNLFVGGTACGAIDFGGGRLLAGDRWCKPVVARLESRAGAHASSALFGQVGEGVLTSLVAADGSLWVTGYSFGDLDFGGGSLPSSGDSDAFLARLSW